MTNYLLGLQFSSFWDYHDPGGGMGLFNGLNDQ